MLNEVRELVGLKIKPLTRQIIEAQKKDSAFIVIGIKSETVNFIAFGKKLSAKMKACFNSEDNTYIAERLKKNCHLG